jgi:phospholipid/cholesterol/gamma-HCH transport system substrate-binding protein
MENRAPYALIGAFVLAAIAAVFGFVYWLNNTGGLHERAVYQVRFENTVSGLLTGAAVLFNGIRVGEVTDLRLDPDNPNQVTATVAVVVGTPVRPDTQASLDFQGLTGVPVVTLQGGNAPASAWPQDPSGARLLVADPRAGQSMTNAARDALRRLDGLISDNSESIKKAIDNIEKFSEALGRNSDRVDNIAAGLERMTGGAAATAPRVVFDLTIPRDLPSPAKPPDKQLVVAETVSTLMYETRKIIVQPEGSSDPSFAGAEWSDNIPKLVQLKVAQSLENAKFVAAAARPADTLNADYRLLIDVRAFQVSTKPTPVATVEYSVKIVGQDDRIVASRIFHAETPVSVVDAAAASGALDAAFGKTVSELVTWVAGVIQ